MPEDAATIDVRFLGHASVLLEAGGLRILTDPLFRATIGPLVRHGPVPDPASLPPVDVVLVSHGHPDHFDRRSLAAVPGDPLVIVPRGLGRHVPGLRPRVVEVTAGDTLTAAGTGIRAVPARHWVTPGAPRAEPLGFLVETPAGAVYFAGDTGRDPSMRALRGRVDLALLPVWTWGPHLGPGHLGPRAAAEVLADLGASAALPIHWGTLYPRQLHRLLRGPLAEPGPRFAAHAALLAPAAHVAVLGPGEAGRLRLGSPAAARMR